MMLTTTRYVKYVIVNAIVMPALQGGTYLHPISVAYVCTGPEKK